MARVAEWPDRIVPTVRRKRQSVRSAARRREKFGEIDTMGACGAGRRALVRLSSENKLMRMVGVRYVLQSLYYLELQICSL